MLPQPLIAVKDVETSSRWYQSVLGLESAHGGNEYERLTDKGVLVLQLHDWDAHEHPHLGDEQIPSRGNGVLLWFHHDNIDAAYQRAISHNATILEPLHINPRAQHREFWIRDPDGYVVVVSGKCGDLGPAAD